LKGILKMPNERPAERSRS
jgi:hypothetical protein